MSFLAMIVPLSLTRPKPRAPILGNTIEEIDWKLQLTRKES